MMLSVVAVNYKLAKIEELELDASVSETHTFKNQVTSHPVEQGSMITDHSFLEPNSLQIEGFITNTPVLETSSPRVRLYDSPDRVTEAFRILTRIREQKELVTIVTGLLVYGDMMLTNLVIPRNKTVGIDTLRFTADFIQIQFVKSATVSIDKIKDTQNAKNQAAKPQDKGSVDTSKANESQKTFAKSMNDSLTNALNIR
jgi:hypothetical protein